LVLCSVGLKVLECIASEDILYEHLER